EGTLADSLDRKNVRDARNGFGLGGVELRELAAKNRTASNHGIDESGRARVDTKLSGARGFRTSFVSIAVVSDDGEVVGIFQGDGLEVGNGQLRSVGGELAVGQKLFARAMQHAAILRMACVATHVPALGS